LRSQPMIHLASLTYERQDVARPDWKALQFGRLFWGGPSKDYFQILLDVVPLVTHRDWFIGNALVQPAPSLFGEIRAIAGKMGDTRRNIYNKIGHIGTRETPDGARRQYYGQLLAVPIAAIVAQGRKEGGMNCLILRIRKEEHENA